MSDDITYLAFLSFVDLEMRSRNYSLTVRFILKGL